METYGKVELYLYALDGGVVSFTPRPLYPRRKRFLYPLDRRLAGPQLELVKYSLFVRCLLKCFRLLVQTYMILVSYMFSCSEPLLYCM